MRGKRISNAERRQIARRYQKGEKIVEIAKDLGLAGSTMSRIAKEMKIPLRRPKFGVKLPGHAKGTHPRVPEYYKGEHRSRQAPNEPRFTLLVLNGTKVLAAGAEIDAVTLVKKVIALL